MPTAEGFRVATAYVAVTIEDGDIQAMIERAVTEACAKAGDDGGTLLAEEITAKVDGAAADLSGPLIDSLSGAGDTAAAEIAATLTEGIAGAGDAGGAELAAALDSATAEVGSEIADRIGSQLDAELPAQAAEAAAGLVAELDSGTATVGQTMADHIGQQLTAGLEEAARTGAAALAQLSLTGASSMSGVVAAAGAGAGIMGALTASVVDAAAEAGALAGAELARNLSEAAVMALSDADFEAFTAQLVASASEAGDAAGVAAADSLGAGFASEAGPMVDLIAANLSTAGVSMATGAQAMAETAAEAMVAVERSTLTGAQAYEAELDAVFEAIHRGGEGLSVNLSAAMVEAFQGIEADTSGFTATEMRLFEEFFQTLETQGDEVALNLASRMNIINTSLLGKDLLGAGLSSVGAPMSGGENLAGGFMAVRPAAGEAEAALGGVEKAAAGAEAGLGGMAGMMGGPWLWGILGAVSILPMFSGLLGSNSQAAQQAAQMHQQLAAAVAQDSGAVGDNTTAMIQQALAQSNLTGLSQQLGLSQAQLIEYAAGEADVQQQVAAAYEAKTGALSDAAGMTGEYFRADTAAGDAAQGRLNQLTASKQALDAVTQSVLGAIFADRQQAEALLAAEQTTQIYTAAVADLVTKQKLQAEQAKMNADATGAYLLTVLPGTQAYTDAVNNQVIALSQNRLTAQINAQALNESLPPQAQLSDAAREAALEYQAAGTEASAYKAALDGLYGQYGTTSDAQAAFTVSLDGLNGKITAGKDAVNLNTEAGAKNYQQFSQTAKAAENYATQLYQQTNDAGQATDALKAMATKLDDAATKAHLTTAQVHELNLELFGVPDIKDITVQLDQTPARKAMNALDSFIKGEIADINNTPIRPGADSTFVPGAINSGGPRLPAHATGGPVQAGAPVIVGDGGRAEVFVPNSDGRIYPSIGAGAQAMAKQGIGGAPININFYGTQYPTAEQMQLIRRDFAIAAGNRGGLNG